MTSKGSEFGGPSRRGVLITVQLTQSLSIMVDLGFSVNPDYSSGLPYSFSVKDLSAPPALSGGKGRNRAPA